jgi:RNA polymerase sigma factor (sigma-70 family)
MNQQADFSNLCKSLARRYRNTQQFDDLVSEGVLACYEALADGKTTPADFTGAARRAMHDYINVKTKAVSIPVGSNAKEVSKAMSSDTETSTITTMSEGTLLSLVQAMTNLTESATDDTAFTVDHAEAYEEKEYHAHVLSVAKKTLTATEMTILNMRYFQDMTQDEVADALETNKMWVSRHEKDSLVKLKQQLVTIRDVTEPKKRSYKQE